MGLFDTPTKKLRFALSFLMFVVINFKSVRNFNHDNLDDTKILHFVDLMQTKYITHWKHSLCNSQKLEFYNVFKDSYTLSTYFDVTRKNPNGKTLVKLRICK